MDTPFFSIITPSFNRARFLPGTIKSVLQQTFENFEYIIIDDASDDNTKEIVDSFNDNRLVYYRNEKNIERGASRNKGIEISKGKYICFLDSDDAFCPNHLQVFYDFIVNDSSPAMLFTNSFLVEGNTERVEKIVPKLDCQNILKYLLVYTPNPARVCIERSILNEFRFDDTIPGLEDIDLWLRIAIKYPVKHIWKYTNIYSVHKNSYTLGDSERYQKELKNFKYIFAKPGLKNKLPYWGRNRLLSMCYFHLSQEANLKGRGPKALMYAFRSFILYPPGYNRKTNKIVAATIIYNIPILGYIIKSIYKLITY